MLIVDFLFGYMRWGKVKNAGVVVVVMGGVGGSERI